MLKKDQDGGLFLKWKVNQTSAVVVDLTSKVLLAMWWTKKKKKEYKIKSYKFGNFCVLKS